MQPIDAEHRTSPYGNRRWVGFHIPPGDENSLLFPIWTAEGGDFGLAAR